jgi:hypothetical protein
MRRRAIAFAFAAIVVGAVTSPAPARADALFVVVSGKKYHDLQHRTAKAEADAKSATDAYGREHDAYLREREAYENEVGRRRSVQHELAEAKAQLARLSHNDNRRVAAQPQHKKAPKRRWHHVKLAAKPIRHHYVHHHHAAARIASAPKPAEPVRIAVAPSHKHVAAHPTHAPRPQVLGWGQP